MARVIAVLFLALPLMAVTPVFGQAAWPPTPVVPAPGCTATPAEVEANKRVASDFFRAGVTAEERIALLDPGYIQHNPVFKQYAIDNQVSDYEAFKAIVGGGAGRGGRGRQGGAQAGPQPPANVPLDVVVGACDIVTIIHRNYRQDPTAPPGTFYETFTWDAFRVLDGKLVEHWDGATLPAGGRGN